LQQLSIASTDHRIGESYRDRGIKSGLLEDYAVSMPQEAKNHSDVILLGFEEKSFPEFLEDFRR
jgi:hypothetical protein